MSEHTTDHDLQFYEDMAEGVKWFSKKKYTCKRNKGEHEWGEPVIKYKAKVRYNYETEDKGMLNSNTLHPDLKFINAEISVVYETKCKHCGKKVLSFLSDKLK